MTVADEALSNEYTGCDCGSCLAAHYLIGRQEVPYIDEDWPDDEWDERLAQYLSDFRTGYGDR
jgi:hypothetical protein